MTSLKLSDFSFILPESLIAQYPSKNREDSRLMVVHHSTMEHHKFKDLPDLLERQFGTNALLVFNDTQVIKARLKGHKIHPEGSRLSHTKGGKVELLLCEPISATDQIQKHEPLDLTREIFFQDKWRCLAKPSKLLTPGTSIQLLGERPPKATVISNDGQGWVTILFEGTEQGGFIESVRRIGSLPLPPYIERDHHHPLSDEDEQRYQTVYGKHEGAVAAPTAGLHFTNEMLDILQKRGFSLAFVTLHVGAGTFLPVKMDDIADHVMHNERYFIPIETRKAIEETKQQGGTIIAIGTTVLRTLEAATRKGSNVPKEGPGETQIFIYPPYTFRCVDALLTNFHLPQSTLLMLVSAFAGRARMLEAYNVAIQNKYRFFSYGDAMLIPRVLEDVSS